MRASITNLGQAVRSRRKQLDLTQQDVAQAGGPSDTTQTAIETESATSVRKETLRKLDAGLQWMPGSAEAAYHGGTPTPLPGTPGGTRKPGAADGLPTVQTHRIRAEPLVSLVLAVHRLREGITDFRSGDLPPEDFADIAERVAAAGAGVIREFLGGTDQMDEFADALKYLASDSTASAKSSALEAGMESSSRSS
ncbi:helix-turn-helix domain-containing protein [Nocardia wallacei]|uniref:helix-turn-helix domain-containing protein n=1 Tax=Nocardia wallacei TaxID=480035 RepID=UPI002458CCA7|nr:helix-turn-helix domain-containing protein [Nocardia wallacei]